MLTIQPNFSQRLHSQPMFKGKYDTAEDVDFIDVEEAGDTAEFTDTNPRNLPVLASSVNNTDTYNEPSESAEESLKGLQDDINDAVNGVKKLEDRLHPAAKKSIDALCLVGGGAVVGISTKLGWNETGKILSKIANNPTVLKCKENMGKLGKKFAKGFKNFTETKFCKSITDKFSQWGQQFAETKFGGKVCKFFKRVNESKPIVALKNLFGKTKKADASKASDTVGDVVAFSTGASTTVAGAIPDKKKNGSKTENKDAVDTKVQEQLDEDEDDAIVD